MKTIYQKAINLMDKSEIAHHESDLYLKVNDLSTFIINEYEFKGNVRKFRSQIDNCYWYDIPFAYDPFWPKKQS